MDLDMSNLNPFVKDMDAVKTQLEKLKVLRIVGGLLEIQVLGGASAHIKAIGSTPPQSYFKQ